MERYETLIKIEEIRRLTEDNQYVKALKVINTIDVNKIKSLTDLSVIADIYAKNEEYDNAMEVLLRVYKKNKARRILYQLVDLSIKRGNIEESEEYLRKYIKIAPSDPYRFVFQYCIDKLKNEPFDLLIDSLEQLKEYEYYEVWAYELAKLYHKAGMKDKCVRECSDIVLWFGEGLYVDKAKLLKAYYVGEIDPVNVLKAKDREETRARLGLDKTKDYTQIKSQIDKILEAAEETQKTVPTKVAEEIIEGIEEEESPLKKEQRKSSAYDDLMEAGIWGNHSAYEKPVTQEQNAEDSTDSISVLNAEEDEDKLEESGIPETLETLENLNIGEALNVKEYLDMVKKLDITEPIDIEEDKSEEERPADIEKVEIEDESPETKEMQTTEEAAEKGDVLKKENTLKQEAKDQEDTSLKELFGQYISNTECKPQIIHTLERIVFNDGKNSNFIITGHKKSGKTYLAKGYAKFLHEQEYIATPRVAKISAIKLNKISLEEKISSILDSTVIVEEASQLTEHIVKQMIRILQQYDNRIYFVLEDEKESIDEFLQTYPALESLFTNRVDIPLFTTEDLYGVALCFIESTEYQLSVEGKQRIKQIVEDIVIKTDSVNRLEAVIERLQKVKESADQRYKIMLANMAAAKEMDYHSLSYLSEEDFE